MNQIFYPLTSIKRTPTNQINKVIYYTNTLPEIQLHHSQLKQAIFNWLRQLNQDQLDDVMSFTSYFRVHQYLKMYKNDQKTIHEYSQLPFSPFQVNVRQELKTFYQIKPCQRLKQLDSSALQYILDHIYVSDYEWLFDTITLKGDVEQIISTFDNLSKGTIFTKSGDLESYDKEEYFEINLKKQKQFLTLSEQLMDEFEIAILTKYRQLQDGKIYTQPKKLLDLKNVRLNFASLDLKSSYTEFQKCFSKENQESFGINEYNLLHSWNQDIKMQQLQFSKLYSEISHYFQNPQEIFHLPIKLVLNEYVVFSKFLVSQQLLKTYPLQQQISESKKSKKSKNQPQSENKQNSANQIKQTQQLQQVGTYFKSSFKSQILPENEQKLFSKDTKENEKLSQKEDVKTTTEKEIKIDLQKDSQLQQEQQSQKELQQKMEDELKLIECTGSLVKNYIEEALVGLDTAKKFKKAQQKKAKNQKKQYMSECTSNCTEYLQPHQQQQEIQFCDEEWINNTQTKNQRKKQRKRENQDKKKNKKLTEIQHHEEETKKEDVTAEVIVEEINHQQEQIKDNNQEQIQCITTSTHDDDADFIEVKQKRASGKKKKITLKKEIDQPLKKQLSAQQNYLSDDYKVENTTPQKIKILRNEIETTPPKPGLVKSPSKEQQIFKYDLDKGFLKEIYNRILENKIARDIAQIYEQEQEKLNKFRAAREVSIARAQHIIKAHFRQYQVDSKVFGSSRTGLALHDSDVDMVVFGIPIFVKQQLCGPMSHLLDAFSQMKWVVSHKHISQAAIPLLKITIDPSINFTEFQNNTPKFYIINHNYRSQDQLNLRYGQHSQLIQIDITFELSSPYQPHLLFGYQGYHIGLMSTDYQRQISESIIGFTEVAIILKRMLKQKELNDSYTGGVSSFCLAIMIAAVGENQNYGEKLMCFLKKYGQNFDPQKQCISLLSDETFQPIDEPNDRLPLTIISPINEEKIQIFVYKIQEILQVFGELYLELTANINQIETSLQKKVDQKELLNLYNNNIEKLVDLVSWQNQNLLDNQF